MTTAAPSIDDLTDEMIESAVGWRLRMDGGEWTATDEAELEAWLQADERHPLALSCSGQVWSFFDQHSTSPELLGAHRALLGRVEKQARGRWTGPAAVLRMPRGRMAAGFLVAAVLCGAAIWPLATRGDVYRSGVGERRIVILKDGSVLSLDAMSRVTVRYSKGARRLKLERGQARFDVAHDPSRPFTVAVRDQSVVATGTAFNIDMTEPEVRVTLIQGRVLVLSKAKALRLGPPAQPSKAVELRAGQVLVAPPDATASSVQAADIEQATAWQQGKLDFENEPLEEAVEKVNRYTNRKIRVADQKAAAVRVSGAFDAGDVNAFIGAVTSFLPVRAIQGSDGVILTFAGPDSEPHEES